MLNLKIGVVYHAGCTYGDVGVSCYVCVITTSIYITCNDSFVSYAFTICGIYGSAVIVPTSYPGTGTYLNVGVTYYLSESFYVKGNLHFASAPLYGSSTISSMMGDDWSDVWSDGSSLIVNPDGSIRLGLMGIGTWGQTRR